MLPQREATNAGEPSRSTRSAEAGASHQSPGKHITPMRKLLPAACTAPCFWLQGHPDTGLPHLNLPLPALLS